MQEAGDTDFSGSLDALRRLATELDYPVLVKEVGHGSNGCCRAPFQGLPIAAVDVAGAGGTSPGRAGRPLRRGAAAWPTGAYRPLRRC